MSAARQFFRRLASQDAKGLAKKVSASTAPKLLDLHGSTPQVKGKYRRFLMRKLNQLAPWRAPQ